MSRLQDGRELLTVGKGTAAVLAGEDDIANWEDEELARGRRRDRHGNFTGQPPRLIPAACYSELKRRQVFDAESTLGRKVLKAAEYLADVAEGKEPPVLGRIRACEGLLDRVVGKPKDSLSVQMSVTAQVETLPWVQTLRNSVRGPGGEKVINTTATPTQPESAQPESPERSTFAPRQEWSSPACTSGNHDCTGSKRMGDRYVNCVCVCHSRPVPPAPAPEPIDDDDDDFVEEDLDEVWIVWPPVA